MTGSVAHVISRVTGSVVHVISHVTGSVAHVISHVTGSVAHVISQLTYKAHWHHQCPSSHHIWCPTLQSTEPRSFPDPAQLSWVEGQSDILV